MKRYKYREELAITTMEGVPIKEIGMQMYLHSEGIEEKRIMEMFSMYANSFAGLIDEESKTSIEPIDSNIKK